MDAFYAYLDSHHHQFLEELKTYLRQPSVAAQNHGMAEMAQLTQERLQARGFKTRLIPTAGFPVVYGEIGEGPRTLLIYDHYDVQPADPLDLWESPPFEPTIRDGNLYARGVADNKGDQMCRMQAIEAWLATQGDLPLKIKWVIEGEEEIGSQNLASFAQAHADLLRADGCLWEFGNRTEQDLFSLTLGLKGIAYFELRAKYLERDVHSGLGPVVPNPAWQLLWALNTLKSPDNRITLDGYWEHVVPPTAAELALADSLPFDGNRARQLWGVNRFINNMDDVAANRAIFFDPTLTICGIDSGYIGEGSKTIVPKDARVKLDFRLVPNLTPELIQDLLPKHLARRGFTDIEVAYLEGEHCARTSPDAAIVQAAQAAGRIVYGHEPVIIPTSGGSGPMYPLSNQLGIPAVCAGIGYQGARVHAPNEHIRLNDYWLGQKFIGELIRAFAVSS